MEDRTRRLLLCGLAVSAVAPGLTVAQADAVAAQKWINGNFNSQPCQKRPDGQDALVEVALHFRLPLLLLASAGDRQHQGCFLLPKRPDNSRLWRRSAMHCNSST